MFPFDDVIMLAFSLLSACTSCCAKNRAVGGLRYHTVHVYCIHRDNMLGCYKRIEAELVTYIYIYMRRWTRPSLLQIMAYPLISTKVIIWTSNGTSVTHWGRDKMAAISQTTRSKRIFVNENVRISIKKSLKFVPNGPVNNILALVQIMAWRRPGDKPLSEPMVVSLLTHICVTRPQWGNWTTGKHISMKFESVYGTFLK